ncbi:hypothetical protein VP01_404g7 [Puccinia sorghi]|uniref:Uncharacterized protein n=1 Tax=Puccinia sorghi TaxID=27349 RepID=A0A0L6URN7_9BASI|nr:hypothetical protein VP01_404g7 [Puccinia sorghi]
MEDQQASHLEPSGEVNVVMEVVGLDTNNQNNMGVGQTHNCMENEEMLNKELRREKTTHAQQLRGALDQIALMEREDFFDQPLNGRTEGIKSNEWIDWLYNDLENVDVGTNKDQEEPDEPLAKVNDMWHPFKNKMVVSSGLISWVK